MKYRTSAVLAMLLGIAVSASAQVAGPDVMMKGVDFTRVSAQYQYNHELAVDMLWQLAQDGTNWVTINPVWFMRDTGYSAIYPWGDSSPSDNEIRSVIGWAREYGLKVMLRPQIRCSSGVWIGRHHPRSSSWFDSYRDFILHYALIAQDSGCQMFCVGSELDSACDDAWERDRWAQIIYWVKGVYLGPVTYAADWRTYRSIPFWDSLDYVGINAYFPLYDPAQPDPVPDSMMYFSWVWESRWIPEIENFLDSTQTFGQNKPVIFTEVGYRSITDCARYPWDNTTQGSFNAKEQRDCYMAALHVLLGEPWFAGWFWHEWTTYPFQGGTGDLTYSPKNKPAQEVLRRWFAAIGTQRCITFTPRVWDRDCYCSEGAERSLPKLAATGAEWVSILPQGWMDTVNTASVVVRDTSIESPFSSTDSSLTRVIAWSRGCSLNVVLKPHVDTRRGAFRSDHNPQGSVREEWFANYTDFITRYARFAEQESCELLCIGCELDGTANEEADIELWHSEVIPAVRQAYSGPITYTKLCLDGGVLLELWQDLDFVGVDAYFQLFPLNGYEGSDTTWNQVPDTFDIRWNQDLGWEHKWLHRLDTLRQATDKPIIFPEIGYQPLDSSAALGARPTHHNWLRQCSGTTLALYSVCFPVDTITGFAVGDSGIILRTLDGGGSWDSRTSTDAPRTSLRSVSFPENDRVGFAVGYVYDTGGMIVRTTNRGDDWYRQTIHWPSGQVPVLSAVDFAEDTTVGFAVGDAGCLLRTTNVGADWHPESSGTSANLRSIHFPCADTGFIVGDSGVVLRTTDAGSTWDRCSSGITDALRAVCFSSSRIGYAVGDSGIYLRTYDGGGNWSCIQRKWSKPAQVAVAVPRTNAADSSVYVSDDLGNILRVDSVDTSWVIDGGGQAKPTRQRINSICFPDSLVGFAVGDSGVILKTREGGRNRVDFNEMRNCYEAAFRALWRNKETLDPLPWFYGFHWYDWWIQPEPKGVDHEAWLENMTMQQKPAQEILEVWFAARPADPGPYGHHVRHYPTGSLDVVVPQNGKVNVPLVHLRLESRSWEGGGPADQARLLQEYCGQGDTIVKLDSTDWFNLGQQTVFDTDWRFLSGQGKYRFYVQYLDYPDKLSPPYPDFEDTVVVFDTTAAEGSISINGGDRFATAATCSLGYTVSDAGAGVRAMRPRKWPRRDGEQRYEDRTEPG